MRGHARDRSVVGVGAGAAWLALIACGSREEPPAPAPRDAAVVVDAAPTIDAADAPDASAPDAGGGFGLEGFGPGSGDHGIPGGLGVGRTAPGPRPRIRIGVATATGGLAREVVRRGLERDRRRFEYCYEKALLVDPTLDGAVTVTFTIGLDGAVAAANASGLHPVASECMAAAVSPGHFPARKAGTPCEVVARIECSYAERRAR